MKIQSIIIRNLNTAGTNMIKGLMPFSAYDIGDITESDGVVTYDIEITGAFSCYLSTDSICIQTLNRCWPFIQITHDQYKDLEIIWRNKHD